MNEQTPIMHTFSSDIEEEIKKKDANIINIATTGTKQIPQMPPPNYKIIFTLVIIFIILSVMALSFYIYKNNINNNQTLNIPADSEVKDTVLATTSSKVTSSKQNDLSIYMPDSKNSLSPYISFINQNKEYMLYKVMAYDGLQSALLNNENKITSDLSRYYGYHEPFDEFKDVNISNVDIRVAKETLATGSKALYYGVVNRAYVIFANSNTAWQAAYNQTLK